MSEEIQPALTAEEWAEELRGDPRQRLEWAASEAGANDALSVTALAALALRHAGSGGGPVFTWEDVRKLDLAINAAEWTAAQLGREKQYVEQVDQKDFAAELRHLRSRLASILPPREP